MNKISATRFYEVTELNVGSGNFRWLFIPGGPGMAAICFKKFSEQFLKEDTVYGLTFTGERKPNLDEWAKDISRVIDQYRPNIIIAHSFGGMALLTLKQVNSLVSGIVLMSTAPDMKWLKNVEKANLTKKELSEMQRADKRYWAKPSELNLRRLWASWAPYYFTRRKRSSGRAWLLRQSYICKAFEKTSALLSDYRMKMKIRLPVLIISGTNDLLTPISCFSNLSKYEKNFVTQSEIPKCGHFPWIDNSVRLSIDLIRFKKSILS